MIGKFSNICGSGSGNGSHSSTNTQVREEDVKLQENYEEMGITLYEFESPKFHNQKDINTFLYRDFYSPGTFWKPEVGGSGEIIADGRTLRHRIFGRPIVVQGEATVYVDPSFETRIYKTTNHKLIIVAGENLTAEYDNSPEGTMFVVTNGAIINGVLKPFIAEYRPYTFYNFNEI